MGMIASQINQPHHCLLNHLFRRRSKKTSNIFPFDDIITNNINPWILYLCNQIKTKSNKIMHIIYILHQESGIRNQEFFIWTNNNKLQITVSYRKESAFLWVRNRDKPIIRNISTSKYTCWMSLENPLRHLAAVMDFPSLGRHILIKFCWALYMMKMMSWEISKYKQTNNDNNNHNNNNNDYNNKR